VKGTPRLFLFDGSHAIFRAYHALPHLSTQKGVPTNAVYGFTTMLLKALREGEPTHVAVCYDREARVHRSAIYSEYKANRPPAPDDLASQFPLVREVVRALRVAEVEKPGFEADDVIATLTRRARAQGWEVTIIGADKDLMQLVDEHVLIWDTMYDKRYGPAEVEAKLGVPPAKVVDLQSLLGDEIDNIPGIPGVGDKTASGLIKKFGDLETLLSHVDEIEKPKLRQAVTERVEQIRTNRKLVELISDLDLELPLDRLAVQGIDEEATRRIFTDLEFSRLVKDLPRPPPTAPAGAQRIATADDAAEHAKRLAAQPELSLVVLVSETPAGTGETVGLALGAPGEAVYFHGALMDAAAPALAAATLHGHGLKAAWVALEKRGLAAPRALGVDAEVASFLLSPNRREHGLVEVAREHASVELPSLEELQGEGRKKLPLAALPQEKLAAHACACAEAGWRLHAPVRKALEESELWKLYEAIERPLIPVLAEMEKHGVGVDASLLRALGREIEKDLHAHLGKIYELAGREFNVDSNPEIRRVFYEELRLPVLKRTKTGPSTDAEVLEKLAEQHPLPREVLDYRALSKLKSTYIDVLPDLVGRDGRIRTTFLQVGAATGRIASENPNLQNIPIRTELGKRIREAFVPSPGWLLLSADYSQIELRLLAHVSADPSLVDSFRRDEDVHRRTAAEVYGARPEEVSSEQRRVAKMINYAIAYGLSAWGLSTRLDIPDEEARAIIQRYFERYAGVKAWLDAVIAETRKTGEVRTLFGRRRPIPDIQSRNPGARGLAERTAVNTPIQGTAADLLKRAMISVSGEIKKRGLRGRMILTVHDELLFETPEDELGALREAVVKCMEGAAELRVPLKVDPGHGRSWAEAH
jgi:DNA polymerase-1